MANFVSYQQGSAPVVPAPQNLTFTPVSLGANAAMPSNQTQVNNGYKGMPWLLSIFVRAFPFFAPSLGTPYSGQLFPRSSGGVGSSGQNNPE